MSPKSKKPKKPPIDKKSVRARLLRARDEQLMVSVRRWIPNADRIDGFVTAVGEAWVQIADLDRTRLDGWCLLRLKDIQAVFLDPDPESLPIKVLKARNQWPPVGPELELDSGPAAVASAAAAAPLTSIFVEFDRPDICWVGAVTSLEETTVKLLEVDTQAEWRRKPRAIDIDDLTRVDFGGDYEESLALVAGRRPTE